MEYQTKITKFGLSLPIDEDQSVDLAYAIAGCTIGAHRSEVQVFYFTSHPPGTACVEHAKAFPDEKAFMIVYYILTKWKDKPFINM